MGNTEEELRQLRALAAATAAQIAAKAAGRQPSPPRVLSSKRSRLTSVADSGNEASAVSVPPPPLPPAAPTGDADMADVNPNSMDLEPEAFEVVQVPIAFVGLFIGKGGSGIRRIQSETGAGVTVGKLSEGGVRKVCLMGSQAQREHAQQWIADFVAAAAEKSSHITKVLEVPDCFARDVIGPKGAVIRAVREETNVSASLDKEAAVGDCRKLTLKGSEASVAQAKEQVERLLLQLHRREGLFNAPLEEQFREAPGGACDSTSGTEVAAPLPGQQQQQQQQQQQRQQQHSLQWLAADASGISLQPPPPSAMQSVSLCGSIVPYDDILKWAAHYANETTCVAHYLQLKAAGARLGVGGLCSPSWRQL